MFAKTAREGTILTLASSLLSISHGNLEKIEALSRGIKSLQDLTFKIPFHNLNQKLSLSKISARSNNKQALFIPKIPGRFRRHMKAQVAMESHDRQAAPQQNNLW